MKLVRKSINFELLKREEGEPLPFEFYLRPAYIARVKNNVGLIPITYTLSPLKIHIDPAYKLPNYVLNLFKRAIHLEINTEFLMYDTVTDGKDEYTVVRIGGYMRVGRNWEKCITYIKKYQKVPFTVTVKEFQETFKLIARG